jgi:hypothetical protein
MLVAAENDISSLDHLFETLETCLCGLVQEHTDPSFQRYVVPEFHVSVLAQGSLNVEPFSVLIQGYLLNASNIDTLIRELRMQQMRLENCIASNCRERRRTNHYHNGDDCSEHLQSAIEGCVFSLNLLPQEAAPMMVLITDGVCR